MDLHGAHALPLRTPELLYAKHVAVPVVRPCHMSRSLGERGTCIIRRPAVAHVT